MMMQGFKLFSDTTGLQASPSKIVVFCFGMHTSEVQRMLDMTGFTKGSFPFRYLGIPICSKRISAAECEKIVERMCSRIKVWISRNMSFAERLTLVKSVLMTLQIYWAQIMILPKIVLKHINNICRSFLWSGTTDSRYPGKVVWKNICTKKRVGGLGIING